MALAAFVALVAAAAFAGSRFKPDIVYRHLRKPRWNPPDAVFGPVWAMLYTAIAYAGYLAWRENGKAAWSAALGFWIAQLVFNAAWSWLFFGRHRWTAALIDSAALFMAILGFIATVAPISALAAWLFVPYGVWVAFATVLNGAICWLNRDQPPLDLGVRRTLDSDP